MRVRPVSHLNALPLECCRWYCPAPTDPGTISAAGQTRAASPAHVTALQVEEASPPAPDAVPPLSARSIPLPGALQRAPAAVTRSAARCADAKSLAPLSTSAPPVRRNAPLLP